MGIFYLHDDYLKNQMENKVETEVKCVKCCCGYKKKERSSQEFKSLMNRLSRIEGQINGIKRMLENDAYCPDILIQVSAANAALNSFGKELLSSHIHTCVVDNIKAGKMEVVDELVHTLQKMMK